MARRQIDGSRHLYIDGQWESSEDVLEVADLADGGVFSRISAATPEQAKQALCAANESEVVMEESTIVERVTWLQTIVEKIEDRKEELADAIVREAGKPITSARAEVDSAADRFSRAIEEARDQQGEYIEGTTDSHEGWQAVVKPQPVGTVLCITPYNYPLSTTALKVAPALAAVNAIVLKPASKTPVSGVILAEIIADSNVPPGGFNFVPGRGSVIGDFLVDDERVNAIAVTGSWGAGKRIASKSGMVSLHLELGGNAPAIVFPDAELGDVAEKCSRGAFNYAGQRCSAVSRVLAHESVHDELTERLAAEVDFWERGELFDEKTTFGPLVSREQAEQVEALVVDARERGATLLRGGERDGRYVEPTLLADVPHDARILHEEHFGPVAVVTSFAKESKALELANGSDLGLDAAVFTTDHDRAMRVAEALDVGSVRINGPPSHGIGDIPYGGVKNSGIGREGIGYTIEAFTTTKSIVL